jgi:hypothetical protein
MMQASNGAPSKPKTVTKPDSKFNTEKRISSFGPYFSQLEDDQIIDLLEWCDVDQLLSLSQVSLFFNVFAEHEPLVSTTT